jgi:glucose-6-phosphate isomerase
VSAAALPLEGEAGAMLRRLFARDVSLWTDDPLAPEIADRLGWLDAPERHLARSGEYAAFAEAARQAGFTRVVLLGMGGSSLAPEVYFRTFGPRPGWPALVVLDTTDPGAILGVEASGDLAHTLFLVSSKSGATIETSSLCAYFWERAGRRGSQFVAITDPGSPLERLAGERGFRRVFSGDPDVGGRFSALTAFGLVPAALVGVGVADLLAPAAEAAARERGAALGAFLGAAWREGRDKLTLLTDPTFASFGAWMEQLVAESTGKGGRGIVPIADEPPGALDAYGRDRVFVTLEGGSHDVARGLPGPFALRYGDARALGEAFYTWEVATALAGARLKVNPFDQPDVALSKRNTDLVLRGLAAGQPVEPALGLLGLTRSLRDHFARAQDGDYVAFLAYVRPSPAHDVLLSRMRAAVRDHRGLATTAGYGPRFLHSTGQLHKGGPASGVFVQLESETGPDAAIPGAGYTFGTLKLAQALGDHRALTARGRRVLRVRVPERELGAVAEAVEAALA